MLEPVPFVLSHPFFEDLIKNPHSISTDITLFSYEISHFSGEDSGKRPWNEPAKTVPMLYEGWEVVKEEISFAFKSRERASILSSMKKGAGIFLHVLFWSNGQPVSLSSLPDVSGLMVKPANCAERIQFLLDRPVLFHSFIQLNELMVEQYKHYQVKLAKEERM